MWKWSNKNNLLEGYYTGHYVLNNEFHSFVFHIRDVKTDKITSIYGNSVIKKALLPLATETYVSIRYKGIKPFIEKNGKPSKTKKQFNFDITIGRKPSRPMGKTKTGGRKNVV